MSKINAQSFITSGLDNRPGSEVIKLVSCSTQLSLKFILLLHLKKKPQSMEFLS